MVDSRWSKYRPDTWRKIADVQIHGKEFSLGAVARTAVEQSRAIRPGREIKVQLDEG
jgi:hypothetical protein